jgi:hypothetical protein
MTYAAQFVTGQVSPAGRISLLGSARVPGEVVAVSATTSKHSLSRPLERIKENCSHSAQGIERAVFLVFGVVSAQLQGFQTCSFAEASPKTKNPRSEMATVFLYPL